MKQTLMQQTVMKHLAWTGAIFFLLAACGGSGTSGGNKDGNDGTNGVATTTYYPSGRIAATGLSVPGTATKLGEWQEYFDAADSPPQFIKTYAAGSWDKNQRWREWNQDGSIRDDWTDH